ncbi:MAG: hypothetical protein IKO46_06035 [Salinivirgaceae bacterium]|nr:hypothetical protein [Salinivirgaceae bacterium]
MARLIVVSDAQQEILEKITFALMSEPVQKGQVKNLNFNVQAYTQGQLRGLFNRIHNSTTLPR